MKIRLNIQQRIQFLILGFSTLIFIVAIGYIGYNARTKMLNEAIKLTESVAEEYAAKLEKNLEADIVITRTLAKIQEKYVDFRLDKRRKLIAKAYVNVLNENPQIDAIWDSWDLGALNIQTDSVVRYSYMCWWENGIIREVINTFDKYSASFDERKYKGAENIREPYLFQYPGEPDSVLLTDMSSPVYNDKNQYVGSAAIDFRLTRFQDIVSNIKPYDGSNALLLGNSGSCIGNTQSDMLGKNIKEIYPVQTRNHEILGKIKNGESFSFKDILLDDQSFYFTFKPINIGNTGTPWSLGIVIPINEIYEMANNTLKVALLVGLVGLFVLSIVIWIISKNITTPLIKITVSLRGLAKGKIGNEMKFEINTGDEIAEMGNAFNISIDGLSKKAKFAEEIGQNNLDAGIELMGDEDVLGDSLIEMRDRLIKAKQEEDKRKEMDSQRQWINEGQARFGEILRQNNDDLENLSYEIISNLIDYLDANQGSIFILNGDDEQNKFLELKAAYAFKRRKYIEQKIYFGDGLVGACAVEGERIYIPDVPQSYVEITSGFGDANPTTLLLVPLKFEDKVLGVIEMMSYTELVEYQISFVDKIAESIASSISSVRISMQTAELLTQSKQQAEELAAQEEEMRQNMEELLATQEEAGRKQTEMEGLVNALNSSCFVTEYDLNKKVIAINDAYLAIYGMEREEVVGLYHHDNVKFTDKPKNINEQFWDDLRSGKIKRQRSTFSIEGKEYNFLEVFTPLKDEYGEVYKILKVADDMNDYIFSEKK